MVVSSEQVQAVKDYMTKLWEILKLPELTDEERADDVW